MKDIKLAFPFPKTSRHNLSQDVATSLSMGLVTPVRIVEVLPGDSHRIGASFSLISNPLVKPLLQGVRMRYCRFWIPRRIYHLSQRANNSNFDPRTAPVRYGTISDMVFPARLEEQTQGQSWRAPYNIRQYSNFQASSLFDYLGIAPYESNMYSSNAVTPFADPLVKLISGSPESTNFFLFNAEPYLAYLDICRNYFSDSALRTIAWSMPYDVTSNTSSPFAEWRCTLVSPLSVLDRYMDNIQNTSGPIVPYNPKAMPVSSDGESFDPVVLDYGSNTTENVMPALGISGNSFSTNIFGVSHVGLCVPVNRPDRFSRLFDTRPLTSQNATINSSEITIANLSFLSRLQRYLTRVFFGGSRYTDVMYSVFGQHVPHVDSPVCLDVFDTEIGSELVASTNASETQNPGVLGGYFSASGYLSTDGKRHKKRYVFNEAGYLMDVVYIMPRVFRSAFVPDFYFVDKKPTLIHAYMVQGNFVPDMNGIGWQQPSFVGHYASLSAPNSAGNSMLANLPGFTCEPSWQQYRTLPDVSHGLLNINRSPLTNSYSHTTRVNPGISVNSPLFIFNDRPWGVNAFYSSAAPDSEDRMNLCMFRMVYTDFNAFNSIFGNNQLTQDNIFCIFRYAHQAKRQVSKRFTLSF